MELSQMVLSVCLPIVGGALAGVLSLAIGGYGGLRQLRRELRATQEAVEHIDRKLTRDQKRRAGEASAASSSDMTRASMPDLSELRTLLRPGADELPPNVR